MRPAVGEILALESHGLRHRYAVDLVEEGASMTTIRDLLDHSSVAVSDHYLRRIGASDAVDFARDRTWPRPAARVE